RKRGGEEGADDRQPGCDGAGHRLDPTAVLPRVPTAFARDAGRGFGRPPAAFLRAARPTWNPSRTEAVVATGVWHDGPWPRQRSCSVAGPGVCNSTEARADLKDEEAGGRGGGVPIDRPEWKRA